MAEGTTRRPRNAVQLRIALTDEIGLMVRGHGLRLAEGPRVTGRILAVWLERGAAAPPGDARALAARFGLTLREAEVALALAGGATAGDIARAAGLSVHTVRNQIKAALAKTGMRRQADLVRLLLAPDRG
jgi:DNA-binding CsgD family transcriptional regulator